MFRLNFFAQQLQHPHTSSYMQLKACGTSGHNSTLITDAVDAYTRDEGDINLHVDTEIELAEEQPNFGPETDPFDVLAMAEYLAFQREKTPPTILLATADEPPSPD